MGTVALLISCIIIGILTGKKIIPKDKKLKHMDKVLFVLVFIIIFLMGTIIGADENVISSFASLGLISLVLAVCAMAGSAAFVSVARRLLGIDRYGIKEHE